MMERALIEYAINALWQVPLLAGSVWLLLRLARLGPVTQHRIWLAVLGAAVLLPLHGMDFSGISATRQTAARMEASRKQTLGPLAQNELPREGGQRLAFVSLFSAPTGSLRLTTGTARWLLRLYVATIVVGLFRITRAWLAACRLVRNSQQALLGDRDRTAFEDYSRRLGIKQPQLRESREVASPMVVGGRAPVLLLPEGFARHTEDEIRAALCHELAHIQRQDYLVNVACQVAALPLAWHPAADWIQQRIHMTREMVCDAMAAQEMRSHLGYAKCLLALAHSMLGGRGMGAQGQFLGLFANHTLEERVMRLMETTNLSVRAKTARVVSGVAVMIATAVIAGVFHVAPMMAQADVLPQAAQNPPADADAQRAATEPSSPRVATQDATTPATPKKRSSVHKNGGDGKRREPGPMERPLIDQQAQQRLDDLASEMAEATASVNTPEFKHRMAEAQRRMEEATAELNTPAFKQRMDDLARQTAEATAKFNSLEFKQRMEDAQRQMAEETAKLNSPEFRQRMDDLARQMADATANVNSPEFKRRMDDAQRQMAEATAQFNSPEFKQRMDDLARQMAEETAKFNSPEFKKRMDDNQRQMEQQMQEFSRKYQRPPNP
jgi:beta-lactamase regulating signal transducer with metallopeptidase domain